MLTRIDVTLDESCTVEPLPGVLLKLPDAGELPASDPTRLSLPMLGLRACFCSPFCFAPANSLRPP